MTNQTPDVKVKEYDAVWNALNERGVPAIHSKRSVTNLSLLERVEVFANNVALFPKKRKVVISMEEAIAGKSNPIEGDPTVMDLIFGNIPGPTAEPVAQEAEVFEAKPKEFTLSEDQDRAWTKMQAWVALSPHKAPFFILKGFAGTGKTHLMKMMADSEVDKTIYFTAPTNKATKVLRSMLGRPCKTIYSLLGLKMSEDAEVQELVWPAKMPELSYGCIIVVDEAGMCNSELVKFIATARTHFNAKIMYVGDPAQLLPVKEDYSACWKATTEKAFRAMLRQVMRFDNQLLKLATHLRECVRTGERPVIENDNDGNEGVFKLSERKFLKELLKPGAVPEDYIDTKVIAWRNRTVNEYNNTIREHLGFADKVYAPKDLLMVAKPIEVGGTVIATIDEDLIVESVKDSTVYLKGYEIPVYEMLVRVDGGPVLKLNVPTEDDLVLQTLLNELAEKAKRAHKEKRGPLWREFWTANNKFHRVRYGYAMTAHRAQGSTVRQVFVDFNDIMSNRDEETAYRCAYVAFTRPTQSAYTF